MVVNSRLEVGLYPDLLLKELDRLFERFHQPLDFENNAGPGTVSEKNIIRSVSMSPLVHNCPSVALARYSRLGAVRVDDATPGTVQFGRCERLIKKPQEVLLSPLLKVPAVGFNFLHGSREPRHGVYGGVDQRNRGHDAFAFNASVYACENSALTM